MSNFIFSAVVSQNFFSLHKRTFSTISLLAIALVSLAACTSGSGSDNTTAVGGNNGGGNGGPNYSGPAPLDASVQAFQINVWNNLVADNRCGNCHKQGGQGPTSFVRDDDINLAYQAALTVANLDQPDQSTLVQRMTDNHNCWDNSPAVCANLMTGYIEAWANASSSAATQIQIQAPSQLVDPGASLNHPLQPTLFEQHIYPLLQNFCSNCHREDGPVRQQSPYFASTDINTAYDAAKSRINLSAPGSSRFVQRLNPELHNCWDTGSGVDCTGSAAAMLTAINNYIGALGAPAQVDPGLLISKAMTFPLSNNEPDAQPASTQGRYETNVIAKYEFQQLDPQDDTRVVDLSIQSPQLDLTLSGAARFLPNVGVEFYGPTGKAQGSTTNSRKLHDLLTLTNEYSIEAWVVPANVTQDNTRRIVSYSGGLTERNFTLGQNQYNYESLNRSTAATSNDNGATLFATPDADEALQASLQHVVMNFDPINGRSIYVNGQLATGAVTDDQGGSSLSNWNNSFVLVLGNETQNQNTDWRGTIRMLAIHNRILSDQQILANFDVGVGQKYYIPFSISHLLNGIPNAYIVFEVERFDGYSYLFNNPFFTIIGASDTTTFNDFQIRNMRIGLNGREAPTGQAYANMDITISASDMVAAPNYWLYLDDTPEGINVNGTIIMSEKDPNQEADEFFLSFDFIAGQSSTVDRNGNNPCPDVASPSCELVDLHTLAYEQSDIGLKHFYEINEMYSSLTGVAKDTPSVAALFGQLKTQLPTTEDAVAFATSNQMGIAQLAVGYCDAVTQNSSLRATVFPGVDFAAAIGPQRSTVVQIMLEKLTAQTLPPDTNSNTFLTTQPDPAVVDAHISTLVGQLTSANTQQAVSAICASMLASSIATVQ